MLEILFLMQLSKYILGDEYAIAEYLKTDDYTKNPSEFTVGAHVHDPSIPANLRGEGFKVNETK